MNDRVRLTCVLAHPDDESLGVGGALARYAAEGVETSLVVATRGEHGWPGPAAVNPGPRALGERREAELRAAARILGVGEVEFLGYLDGDVDQADPAEAIARIVAHLRHFRPQVVVTFGPDGAYGHPDHIAVSQLATAAAVCAADAAVGPAEPEPHRVAKLYYRVWTESENAAWLAAFGEVAMEVDGVRRGDVGWPDWAVTTRLDAAAHWRQVRDAVACHRSQLTDPDALARLSPEVHRCLWGCQQFYRAFSTVSGGRRPERDLFEGLR